MPTSQSYKSNLVTFGRHTPRSLRHQILCQLALQYLGINDGVSPDTINAQEAPRPSLQRFHGALLFVDISGFTALSLRLKVEDLKNHINDYFTTMLSIVDRWDGDVIKFAGDALYVIWKTELALVEPDNDENGPNSAAPSRGGNRFYSKNFSGDQQGRAAVRSSLEKATACGLEISSTCCNHEVQLDAVVVEAAPVAGIMSMLPKWVRSGNKVAPSTADSADSNIAYLNVHAGVSFGLMAGVDIGSNDRWEYFLIGDPLHRVAEAEEEAAKGDVVICSESHSLLHGAPRTVDNPKSGKHSGKMMMFPMIASSPELPCGCIRTPKGCFKITNLDARSPKNKAAKLKRTRSKARIDDSTAVNSSSEISQNFRIFEDSCNEIEKLYGSMQGILKSEVISFLNRAELLARAQQKLITEGSTAAPAGPDVTNPKTKEKLILEIMNNDLRKQLIDWFQYCILEDIVKHVHEVARDDYYYEPKPRSTAFRLFLENIQKQKPPTRTSSVLLRVTPGDDLDDLDNKPDTPPPRLKNRNPSQGQFNALVKKASSKYLTQDTAMSAEIRNVMVMFIKINGLEMEMMVDEVGFELGVLNGALAQHSSLRSHGVLRSSGSNGSLRGSNMASGSTVARAVTRGQSIGAAFDFLDRTPNEVTADMLMLNRVQQCMEVLCKVFAETGGQMRQFIVDDKGTVCIGTFGLKGAVGVDNAAAALETAKNIIIRLQGIELTASIGITSGKAYCGLVGSPLRHEYAVMGPSTNLSARLMCKAPAFGVICDIETKNRDRTHGFEPLNEVTAKGYAQPVMTFKPIFEDINLLKNKDSRLYEALSPGILRRSNTQGHGIRGSADWFIGGGGKSVSMQWPHKNSSDSPGGITPDASHMSPRTSPRGVNLSGKHSTDKSKMSKGSQVVFNKRRKSLRDVTMIKEDLLKMNNSKLRLHGREEEMLEIFTFLFPNIRDNIRASIGMNSTMRASFFQATVAPPVVLSRNPSGTSQSQTHSQALSDFENGPVRMVVIAGGEGTGKSALIDAIASKIHMAAKQTPNLVVYTFKNRPSSLEMHVPFHGFKPIIQEMLARVDYVLSKAHHHHGNGSLSSTSKGKDSKRLKISLKESMINGLAVIFPSLPAEMRSWRPLLGSVGLIMREEDNEVTKLLEGPKRTQATVDLLVALIDFFPVITKASMLLVIEEIQSLDAASRQVLFQVWRDCSGVLILATHRSVSNPINNPDQPSAEPQGPLGMSGSLGSALSSTIQSMAVTHDVLTLYDDPMLFKFIELKPLSPEATRSLVLDTFPEKIRFRVDEQVIDKLCEASGGHPLYAYEMTRSLVDKLKADPSADDLSKMLTDLGVGAASNRIEEMICYRFDQLDSSNQMILKAAAVAASNGAPFTLEMLIFVLLDNEPDTELASDSMDSARSGVSSKHFSVGSGERADPMSGETAKEVLEAILQRGEFIQICASDMTQSGRGDSMRRFSAPILYDSLLPSTPMEFNIVLEQITIYNLLVDDQREFLHERVAQYHTEKLNCLKRAEQLYGATLKESAHHWQHGSCYANAMKCYYQLALLAQEGVNISSAQSIVSAVYDNANAATNAAYGSALHSAYSMFASLKQEHNVASYALCSGKELDDAFRSSSSDEHNAPHVIGDDPTEEVRPALWSLELLYNVFNSDVDDVRTAVHVLRALALHELLSHEHPRFILPLLEEGLRILLCLRRPHILANSVMFSSLLVMGSSHAAGVPATSTRSRKKAPANGFFFEDFAALAPPLLFAYALAAAWLDGSAPSEEVRSKSKLAVDELLQLLPRDQQAEGRRAQAACISALLALASHRLSTAEEVLPILHAHLLRGAEASAEVVEAFGVDLSGHTLALLGLHCIVRGEVVRGRVHLLNAEGCCMGDTTSGVLALLPLVSALHLLRDYETALRLLAAFASTTSGVRLLAFLRRLRVWVMCERNQNSGALELSERIAAFGQLTTSLAAEVVAEIIRPAGMDGGHWADLLAYCGLSLPAITAMVFCCATVLHRGAALLRAEGMASVSLDLEHALRDYGLRTAEEYSVLTGSATIAAKITYYSTNIRLAAVLRAAGMPQMRPLLLQGRDLDQQLLAAMRQLSATRQRLATALVGNLAVRLTASSAVRQEALALQRSAVDAIVAAHDEENGSGAEGAEGAGGSGSGSGCGGSNNCGLQRRGQGQGADSNQLWMKEQRIV